MVMEIEKRGEDETDRKNMWSNSGNGYVRYGGCSEGNGGRKYEEK